MKRVLPHRWYLAGLVLGVTLGTAAEAKNLLANPGFEQTQDDQVSTWQVSGSWQGKLETSAAPGVPRAGKRCVRLSATVKDGSTAWGRMFQPVRPREITARRFRFSVWAKGQGECLLGIIQYTPPQPGKVHYAYTWQEQAAPLTDTWRELSQELLVLDPQVQSFGAVVEVRGEGAHALLDDAALIQVLPAGIALRVSPSFAMVAAGDDLRLDLAVEAQGQRLSQGNLKLFLPGADASVTTCQDMPMDTAGTTSFTWALKPAAPTGMQRLIALHVESGAVAEAYAELAEPEVLAAFEQAAAKAKLGPLPAHLLFIGDSLTDFQRGHNYVDKVGFWLRRRFGADMIGYRNVGVGGDFVTRVLSRLNREPNAWRLDMYDSLFEPDPTHVFIFLGHNDSKVSSTSNYTAQAVPPDNFQTEYRTVLEKVRAATKARITLLSASSSVFEICQANAQKATEANRAHSLFGRPDELERYNAMTKAIAAETGAAYLDVYAPTRAHPDKRSLFDPNDGVHLTNAGNRFIALQILDHLGRD